MRLSTPPVLAMIAFALALAIAPLQSAGDHRSPAVTTRYAASDLRTDTGVAQLYRRLQEAAREACAAMPPLDRWRESDRRRCRADALEAAVRRVRGKALTALHRARQRSGDEAPWDDIRRP
jgi:UrcA family protein